MNYRLIKRDKSFIWVLSKAMTEYDKDNKPIRVIGTHIDITQRKEIEIELLKQKDILNHQAHHDVLTGLPNRVHFNKKLKKCIKNAKKYDNKVALLFIDLDHFKEINDSLGHETGDKILKVVTERLSKIRGEKESVARLGGDEFTIIVEDVKDSTYVSTLAQKIVDELSHAIAIGDHTLYI